MNKFKLFSLRKQHGQLHTLYAVGGGEGEGEKREIMVHRLGENIKNFLCCDFRSDGLE